MLTPEEIDGFRDWSAHLVDDVNNYIVNDIARRLIDAGEFTRAAEYLRYRGATLGIEYKKLMREVAKRLNKTPKEIEAKYTEAAKTLYERDADRLAVEHTLYEQNGTLQQIVRASTALAQDDFTNITQTLGMVDKDGKEWPLRTFYRRTMDWVFNNVSTGAMDYNTAIQKACDSLYQKGVTSIGYESGVTTSLEAAVRRNMLGGLGLMVEQVSQYNHDEFGCDGWEISAHEACAADHEPIQGKQYTDAEYKELNGQLKRRIGTLNCVHYASGVRLGVDSPQYTPEELQAMKERNHKGITYKGKHYTMYKATQRQRALERRIRYWHRQKMAAEKNKVNDPDRLEAAKIQLEKARRAYKEFSEAAGLRQQQARLYIVQRKK